ncbi:hypothetical protein HC256_008873 [Beauveria bassiana]|nr:hypothetical protein HC256_008873 [Beauveria bassiana]
MQLTFAFFAGLSSTGALALVVPNSTALALVMPNSTAVAPAVPSSTVMALVMPNSTTLGFPGLNHVQSRNAKAAIDQVRAEGLNRQACLAVISTALQESELQIYANPVVPASMNYPHDKVGGDQDSIGMFQQRAEFYSDVATDMSAAGSTRLFLADMKGIAGWQTMEVSALCQAVQKAEAGNLYGQRIPLAEQLSAGIFRCDSDIVKLFDMCRCERQALELIARESLD